jgi:hypothetical protein
MDEVTEGARIVMPYDTCRLYQIERVKSPAKARRADEQAARLASAVSSLLGGITRIAGAVRRPFPATTRGLPRTGLTSRLG